jgi:iron complex transport system substrate-binding protein
MGAAASRSHRRAIGAALLVLVCGCAIGTVRAAAIVLTDSAHQQQRFEQPPRRIASLLPALTETVCELEECNRLVVVDRYSNWPQSVALLPKAGGLEDVDVERIVSARPDVVLLGNEPRVEERLRSLGLVVFELETETYADIGRNVTVLGAMLGVPQRAARLNLQIEHSVAAVAAATRAHLNGHAPLVYFEVDPAPYGAGPQSFMGQMLERVGARNILPARLGPFPRLNPEYVVRANPDVILVSAADASQLVQRPGWDQIRAVRDGHICTFPSAVRDTIVRPGPRVAAGLQALSQCLLRMAP